MTRPLQVSPDGGAPHGIQQMGRSGKVREGKVMVALRGTVLQARNWLVEGEPMSWRRVFAGRADQAATARKFAAYMLADTGRADDAELIACELISNALLHSRSGEPGGWFGIEVTRHGNVQIAVYDVGGKGIPRFPDTVATESTEHGRGLYVIRDLAAGMGVRGSPEDGHMVWARLCLGQESS
ncbi:ATP-binding protein [Actinomadura sp. NPDC047616]|uniref:ATP-binding protein n=1 Tax=Actinomadura sp. NPDC047616 TaxID=3155914 RepID=UPI0033D4D2AE